LVIGAVALAVVALGTVIALALVVRGASDGRDHVVSGPLGDRREATLEVLDGASSITVRTVDLDDLLYRAATPDDSHLVPRVVDRADRVQVFLAEEGPPGPSAVEIEVNAAVRWTVRVSTGANEELLDLGGGRIAGVEVVGGVSRLEAFLPPPDGNLPVRLSGGANQVLLHAHRDAPARVTIGGGAGTVRLDGTTHSGVPAGQVFTPPAWAGSGDRYDVDVAGGVSTLTLDRARRGS
jgi:hypothetical protein